jgi:hypothetical protein
MPSDSSPARRTLHRLQQVLARNPLPFDSRDAIARDVAEVLDFYNIEHLQPNSLGDLAARLLCATVDGVLIDATTPGRGLQAALIDAERMLAGAVIDAALILAPAVVDAGGVRVVYRVGETALDVKHGKPVWVLRVAALAPVTARDAGPEAVHG